jgi:hypothetical protein
MHQIVYISSAKQKFSTSDFKKLLVRARMRNNAVGVTGMLVFHDGTFLQALEGENRAVNEIFASIQDDPRHGDLTVVHRGPGPEQRVFGEWSMGFADFSGAAAILKGFVRVNDNLNLKDLDSTRAVEFLTACEDDELLKSA